MSFDVSVKKKRKIFRMCLTLVYLNLQHACEMLLTSRFSQAWLWECKCKGRLSKRDFGVSGGP